MNSINIIFTLFVTMVHIACGQIENNGFEKQITTIEYFGNSSDTTVQIIKFDSNGNRIEELPKYISNPIKTDIIQHSDKEKRIEYTWEDNSKSVIKEINISKEQIKIGFSNNGTDTTYFSKFNYNDEGFPTKGIIIAHGDTSKYEISDNISMEEIMKIHSNILSESEFIDFSGIIQFLNREQIKITDLEESKNTIEINLNRNLKPKTIIKKKWHEYHKMIFESKYSYKYVADKLIEISNIDMDGDLEMVRKIKH